MPQVISCPSTARSRCRCPTTRPASSSLPVCKTAVHGPRPGRRGWPPAGTAAVARGAAAGAAAAPRPAPRPPAAAAPTSPPVPACRRAPAHQGMPGLQLGPAARAPSPAWTAATCSSRTPAPPTPKGRPNLCTNPACGVANPPGERNCQRCSTPLPDRRPAPCCTAATASSKLLAMGGFGAVYLATDTKGGNRPVAIKDMICADPQEFAIRLNFFRREAEILRSLEASPDRAARLRLHRAGPDGPPGAWSSSAARTCSRSWRPTTTSRSRSTGHRVGQEHLRRADAHAHASRRRWSTAT